VKTFFQSLLIILFISVVVVVLFFEVSLASAFIYLDFGFVCFLSLFAY
jgi:hypothetical protein